MHIGYLNTTCICVILIFVTFQGSSCKNYEEDVILTLQQKELLDKFRNRMIDRLPHDYMKEDIYLIKWLRTRDYDLDTAEIALMNNLKWRQKQKIDTIHEEDWSDMFELFKYSLEGRDKFGRSILYFDAGGMDLRKAILLGKGERLIRYADKVLDEGCSLVRTLGKEYKNITRGHLIANGESYNVIQHGCLRCLPFLLRMIISYETYFPECADQIIALNVPGTYGPLLNAAKPLLSRDTRESLKIYGKNKQAWKEAMSDVFDFSKLPRAIGGNMTYKGMDEDDY